MDHAPQGANDDFNKSWRFSDEGGFARSTDDVLNAVHEQYANWESRRKGYRQLIAFLAFTALYITVLFLQRGSGSITHVNSTLSAVLPRDSNDNVLEEFKDYSFLLDWLHGPMLRPFRNPECGGDICERPFETDGYGRFGCPEDCGWSPHLTSVKVRLGFTFRTYSDKQRSFWNLCPNDCTLASLTSPDTVCWFSSPQNFSLDTRLIGMSATTLFAIDGNYTLCLIAPGGGVKGQVLVTPANVTGAAAGIATTTYVYVDQEGYVDFNSTEVGPDDASAGLTMATNWQYCGTLIPRCAKVCKRVEACFARCPGNTTASVEEIYTRCTEVLCNVRLYNSSYISNYDICVVARPTILGILNIPGANATMEDVNAPDHACQGNYYDHVGYPGRRNTDYCRMPASTDPGDYCQAGMLGDSICQTSCNTPECNYDYDDCCTLGWPLTSIDDACCDLVTADTEPLKFNFAYNHYSEEEGELWLVDNHSDQHRNYVVGLNNRIVSGILMHTTRYKQANCSSSRFAKLLPLNGLCRSIELSTDPFGADPVFLRSSRFYIESAAGTPERWYDPSQINENGVPFAFFPDSSQAGFYGPGFVSVMSIDLDEDDARHFVDYLQDGFFVDAFTKDLYIQFVTYNLVLELFSNFRILFRFNDGGDITIEPSIITVSAQFYKKTTHCIVRLVLEILVLGGIVCNIYSEVMELLETRRHTGSLLAHYRSAWNYIDLVSIGLLILASVLWIVLVTNFAQRFDTDIFYEIYNPDVSIEEFHTRFGPRPLQLANGGEGLQQHMNMLVQVNKLVALHRSYVAINGVNIILMLLRIIKLCDFQPRLGLLTRTLNRAAIELGHFFFLAVLVFLCYSSLAVLAFGGNIFEMSTIWQACVTMLKTILGDTSVNDQLMRQQGVLYALGIFFFWSYICLVYFILFNFLIAIIIDAFADVKEDAKIAPSMSYELVAIICDRWRCLLKWFFKSYISDHQIYKYLHNLRRSRNPVERSHGAVQNADQLKLGNLTLTTGELAHVLFASGVDQAPEQRMAQSPQAMASALIRRINRVQRAVQDAESDSSNILELCLQQLNEQSQQIKRLQHLLQTDRGHVVDPSSERMTSMHAIDEGVEQISSSSASSRQQAQRQAAFEYYGALVDPILQQAMPQPPAPLLQHQQSHQQQQQQAGADERESAAAAPASAPAEEGEQQQ